MNEHQAGPSDVKELPAISSDEPGIMCPIHGYLYGKWVRVFLLFIGIADESQEA